MKKLFILFITILSLLAQSTTFNVLAESMNVSTKEEISFDSEADLDKFEIIGDSAQWTKTSTNMGRLSATTEAFSVLADYKDLNNYNFEAMLTPYTKGVSFGIVFRYISNEQFYFIKVENSLNSVQVIKRDIKNNKKDTVIAEAVMGNALSLGKKYRFSLSVNGGSFSMAIDGVSIFTANDDSFMNGSCGFYLVGGKLNVDDIKLTEKQNSTINVKDIDDLIFNEDD